MTERLNWTEWPEIFRQMVNYRDQAITRDVCEEYGLSVMGRFSETGVHSKSHWPCMAQQTFIHQTFALLSYVNCLPPWKPQTPPSNILYCFQLKIVFKGRFQTLWWITVSLYLSILCVLSFVWFSPVNFSHVNLILRRTWKGRGNFLHLQHHKLLSL